MSDPSVSPPRQPYTFEVDLRDVGAAVGGLLVLCGCVWINVGLGLVAIGAGIAALAWRLAR